MMNHSRSMHQSVTNWLMVTSTLVGIVHSFEYSSNWPIVEVGSSSDSITTSTL